MAVGSVGPVNARALPPTDLELSLEPFAQLAAELEKLSPADQEKALAELEGLLQVDSFDNGETTVRLSPRGEAFMAADTAPFAAPVQGDVVQWDSMPVGVPELAPVSDQNL